MHYCMHTFLTVVLFSHLNIIVKYSLKGLVSLEGTLYFLYTYNQLYY